MWLKYVNTCLFNCQWIIHKAPNYWGFCNKKPITFFKVTSFDGKMALLALSILGRTCCKKKHFQCCAYTMAIVYADLPFLRSFNTWTRVSRDKILPMNCSHVWTYFIHSSCKFMTNFLVDCFLLHFNMWSINASCKLLTNLKKILLNGLPHKIIILLLFMAVFFH